MSGDGGRTRPLIRPVLTLVSGALVLAALTIPNRLQDLGPSVVPRLPLEALVYLAVALALPGRFGLLRAALALVCGVILGLLAVFKVLDMGFFESLNRPFEVVVDWRYVDSLVGLVRDSFGHRLGTVLLVFAVSGGVALLVLMPLAVLRLTHVAVGHRATAWRVLAALSVLWVALALLGVRATTGTAVASTDAAGYVYGEVSHIASELRDQRLFAQATKEGSLRQGPGSQQLTALRGKDVLLVFIESYGRVSVEGSSFSPGVDAVLDSGTQRLRAAGWSARSAFLTSPTFGGISWLAHSTLESGLWVDSQQRYDTLLTSPRMTLSRVFGRAGWRTVADIPANTRDWPQGAFYHYDHIYDSRNVGYQGPRFGYPTMPDQFTLDAFHRLELAPRHRPPVMAEIDLITSHTPWARTPLMIDQASVGDGSVYDGMPAQLPSETDIWPDPSRVQAAYGKSIQYSLNALVQFVLSYGHKNLVVVFLGDHQPATIVSGDGANHDVPISVVARDPAVLRGISGWGWDTGLHPLPDAPVWRMDAFRDRFLAAYGPRSHTEDVGP